MSNLPPKPLLHRQWVRHPYSKLGFICLAVVAVVAVLLLRNVPEKKAIDSPTAQPVKETQIIVLPHHDLLLDMFPSFYATIVRQNPVKKIILLSPNHFQPESTVIKTTDTDFKVSDEESVPVTDGKNFQTSLVIDNEVFSKEHGILLHVPFIKKYFPEAAVLPLLLTRNLSNSELQSLVGDIQSQLDENTLLLISTDFSHYLSFTEAEKKDQEMLPLIQNRDSERILSLSDDYVDCPACLFIAVSLPQTRDVQPKIIFHGNSAQYLKLSADQPTTSYYVLRW